MQWQLINSYLFYLFIYDDDVDDLLSSPDTAFHLEYFFQLFLFFSWVTGVVGLMVNTCEQTGEFRHAYGFSSQPPCYIYSTRICAIQTYRLPCHNTKGMVVTMMIIVTFSWFNPLSPSINMHVLFIVLHIFLMVLVGRICSHIKTPH